MKANRILLMGAAASIAVLGLYYGARARGVVDTTLPELMSLAPADSRFVAYADVAALRDSTFVQRLAALSQAAQTDHNYTDFVNATGFDYQRDLDRVMITERPSGASGQTLAFAEGRFDREKIEQYALHSGKLEHQGSRDVYEVPSTTPGKIISLTFLAKNRIELADGGDFSTVPADASASLDPGFQQRTSRVAGSPIFALIKAPAAAASGTTTGGAAAFTSSFQAVRWVTLAARPNGDAILLSAEGECDTAEQAQSVATGLELLRGLLRGAMSDSKTRGQMTPASAAAINQVLTAAKVSTDSGRVRLLVTFTRAMLPAAPSGSAPASPPNQK